MMLQTVKHFLQLGRSVMIVSFLYFVLITIFRKSCFFFFKFFMSKFKLNCTNFILYVPMRICQIFFIVKYIFTFIRLNLHTILLSSMSLLLYKCTTNYYVTIFIVFAQKGFQFIDHSIVYRRICLFVFLSGKGLTQKKGNNISPGAPSGSSLSLSPFFRI